MDVKILAENFRLKLPIKDGEWWDGRPGEYSNLTQWKLDFSQRYGGNAKMYAQFGMKGHNGIDIAGIKGTPIVAPCKLWINMITKEDRGYGFHIWAETEINIIAGQKVKLESVFGHFDGIIASPARWYNKGDILGYMDSTGFSTGSHLHFGIRPLIFNKSKKCWEQVFYNNGYFGYIDTEPFLPHMVFDLREILKEKKTMSDLIAKNEKKFIIEGDSPGRKGIIIDGKLREIANDREAAACLYILANNGFGQFVSSEFFDDIEQSI